MKGHAEAGKLYRILHPNRMSIGSVSGDDLLRVLDPADLTYMYVLEVVDDRMCIVLVNGTVGYTMTDMRWISLDRLKLVE